MDLWGLNITKEEWDIKVEKNKITLNLSTWNKNPLSSHYEYEIVVKDWIIKFYLITDEIKEITKGFPEYYTKKVRKSRPKVPLKNNFWVIPPHSDYYTWPELGRINHDDYRQPIPSDFYYSNSHPWDWNTRHITFSGWVINENINIKGNISCSWGWSVQIWWVNFKWVQYWWYSCWN